MHMLSRLGHRVDTATNGLEAIASLALQHYEIVLLDLEMPQLGGLETVRRLRQNPPPHGRPWIIAVTANALSEDRAICLAAGMDDYLAKPFRKEDIAEVFARMPKPESKPV